MVRQEDKQQHHRIAVLVAISCVLQISESLVPHPVPGLRLGLANVITLIALDTFGLAVALEVAVLRTVLSSFVMGTFMSPAFILSFCAALLSTLVMGLLYRLSGFHTRYRLSIVGISVLSALTHNVVQLYLAYLLLVRHRGIFVFLPWLCLGAVVMGWLTGAVAGSVCRNLKQRDRVVPVPAGNPAEYAAFKDRHYCPGSTFFHRAGADKKIAGLLVFSLAVLLLPHPWFYAFVCLLLVAAVRLSGTPLDFLFLRMRRGLPFVLVSFLLPVFFNSGTHVLAGTAYMKITAEGLVTGAVFALRILFLVLASSLLVRTTSPEDLTRGLGKVLSPLRFVHISQERTAVLLSLSWRAFPVVWGMVRDALRAQDFGGIRSLRSLVPVLSGVITALCRETERFGALQEETDEEKDPFFPEEAVARRETGLDPVLVASNV